MPQFKKFPMLVYSPGQPDRRVESEEELEKALNEDGFSMTPTQMTEEGKIQAEIDYHHREIDVLKKRLADMKKKMAA